MLIEDQNKLRDYENIKAWKDGARLLIHEIKNPLTPLKLSIESLLISVEDNDSQELTSAMVSVNDIEAILKIFRDLVNIEFEPTYQLDFITFFNKLTKQLELEYNDIRINNNLYQESLNIVSEENLLKILIINLVKNGMEANPDNFYIKVHVIENKLFLEFVTPDKKIENIEHCFLPGVSSKGQNRGYGLFLCKKIAEYLRLDLTAANNGNDVVFKIEMNLLLIP